LLYFETCLVCGYMTETTEKGTGPYSFFLLGKNMGEGVEKDVG